MDLQRTSPEKDANDENDELGGAAKGPAGRAVAPLVAARTAAFGLALLLGACGGETSVVQLSQPGVVQDANSAVHCPSGTSFAAGQTQGRLSAVWCERPDGRRHGPYVEWWENRQKKAAGLYQDGVRQGVWTFFQSNGMRDSQIEYKNGESVRTLAPSPVSLP